MSHREMSKSRDSFSRLSTFFAKFFLMKTSLNASCCGANLDTFLCLWWSWSEFASRERLIFNVHCMCEKRPGLGVLYAEQSINKFFWVNDCFSFFTNIFLQIINRKLQQDSNCDRRSTMTTRPHPNVQFALIIKGKTCIFKMGQTRPLFVYFCFFTWQI